VVVDAWPTHAFAVAWADWTYRSCCRSITVIEQPTSTGKRNRVLRRSRASIKNTYTYFALNMLKLHSLSDHLMEESYPGTDQQPWTDDHSLPQSHPSLLPPPPEPPKSSDCFLTSACVEARGLSDGCEELSVLRAFRDGYLIDRPGGAELVAEYYVVAPPIVAAIHVRPDAARILESVYGRVARCVDLVLAGRAEPALRLYAGLVAGLRDGVVV
jgi:hypothetical protein